VATSRSVKHILLSFQINILKLQLILIPHKISGGTVVGHKSVVGQIRAVVGHLSHHLNS